ncbi:uncharacterized protein [Argopecten irradians]|uniref:uncharacterized protein n=1 Tax=Argopecten irradians TaxID=31199 RepID=UPI0037162125
MAAGESSSDRMVDEENHDSTTTVPSKQRMGCLKSRTLGLFFVVSILINFLLISIMLGLLLAGKLAQVEGPGMADPHSGDEILMRPVVQGGRQKGSVLNIPQLDQVCIQCDPGDGVKLDLFKLYPINNGTKPLCCKEYNATEIEASKMLTTADQNVSSKQSRFMNDELILYMIFVITMLLCVLDKGLLWAEYDGSYKKGGVTLRTLGSYTMLTVPETGLYIVYSDLEFRGTIDSEGDSHKTYIQVHSLVKYPNKVVQMHRFLLKENDIKKSVATAVLELNAGDSVFVAVKDMSCIYDDSTINRFGLHKLH